MSNQSASGLSLLDSSQLSVCQKITLYFDHQQKLLEQMHLNKQKSPQPKANAETSSKSTHSSSSSQSDLDLDASFQQLLANRTQKLRLEEAAKTADTCIDLCSPSSEQRTPEATTLPRPDFTSSSSHIVGQLDTSSSSTIQDLSQCQLDRTISLLDDDDSLGVAQLDVNCDDDDDDAGLNDSDESFLEHERRCLLSPPPAQPDVSAQLCAPPRSTMRQLRLLDFCGAADETQLADVEAPSAFWDYDDEDDDNVDSSAGPLNASSAAGGVAMDVPMLASAARRVSLAAGRQPMLAVRSRISTIPEESTINSSRSSAQSSRHSHNSSGHSGRSSRSGSLKPQQRPEQSPAGVRLPAVSKHDSARKSCLVDVFPKRPAEGKRNFYADDVRKRSPSASSASVGILVERNERVHTLTAQSPIGGGVPFKRLAGSQVPNNRPNSRPRSGSPRQSCSPAKPVQPAMATPPLSRSATRYDRRQSRLFTAPAATECEAEQSDDEDDDELPQFNDTIEAMDYYMEKGRQMNGETTAAAAQPAVVISVASTSPTTPLTLSSPSLKNRTPDTIRRRLLLRNFLRSSGASPQFAGAGADAGLNDTFE